MDNKAKAREKEGSCLTSCVNYEGCRIDLDHFENKCKQLQSDNERLQKRVSELEEGLKEAIEIAERWMPIAEQALGESNE